MRFEGEPVDVMRIILRPFSTNETNIPFTVDEVVDLQVRVRVTEVIHEVGPKDGKLYRTHILRVQDVLSLSHEHEREAL